MSIRSGRPHLVRAHLIAVAVIAAGLSTVGLTSAASATDAAAPTGLHNRSYLAFTTADPTLRPGQRETFRVRVTGAGGPASGQVQIRYVGAVVGAAKLASNGRATVSTPALPRGRYLVRLVYTGSDSYAKTRSRKIPIYVG